MSALLAAALPAGTGLVVSRPLPRADAIISLASHEWERLPLVVRLAGEHPGAIVLLTEPRVVTVHNCHQCAQRVPWLVQHGIDEPRIRVVRLQIDTTYGEAVAALEAAREGGIRSLVIATSPYHTRRAFGAFRAVFTDSGVAVGVVPAADSSEARPSRWWMADYDRRYVPYEWAAMAYYTWQHSVRSWAAP